jgi:hypothetical protein
MHAATHLLAQGLTLTEIGGHRGHRSADSTRIYAKVDMPVLREVAELDLGGLLAATKSKRQEERAEKLRTVAELCQRWLRAETGKDWKSWICQNQHDITKTFLTRAVSKGDLKPPVRN